MWVRSLVNCSNISYLPEVKYLSNMRSAYWKAALQSVGQDEMPSDPSSVAVQLHALRELVLSQSANAQHGMSALLAMKGFHSNPLPGMDDEPPLHTAARGEWHPDLPEKIKLLLLWGADPDLAWGPNNTPKVSAREASRGWIEAVESGLRESDDGDEDEDGGVHDDDKGEDDEGEADASDPRATR